MGWGGWCWGCLDEGVRKVARAASARSPLPRRLPLHAFQRFPLRAPWGTSVGTPPPFLLCKEPRLSVLGSSSAPPGTSLRHEPVSARAPRMFFRSVCLAELLSALVELMDAEEFCELLGVSNSAVPRCAQPVTARAALGPPCGASQTHLSLTPVLQVGAVAALLPKRNPQTRAGRRCSRLAVRALLLQHLHF